MSCRSQSCFLLLLLFIICMRVIMTSYLLDTTILKLSSSHTISYFIDNKWVGEAEAERVVCIHTPEWNLNTSNTQFFFFDQARLQTYQTPNRVDSRSLPALCKRTLRAVPVECDAVDENQLVDQTRVDRRSYPLRVRNKMFLIRAWEELLERTQPTTTKKKVIIIII